MQLSQASWEAIMSLTLVVLVALAAVSLLMSFVSRTRTKTVTNLGLVCGAVAIYGVGVTIALYGMAWYNAPTPMEQSYRDTLVYGSAKTLVAFLSPILAWSLGTLARAGINRGAATAA